MPYQWVDPDIAIEHKDVIVYHIYCDDQIDAGKRQYWFTVDPAYGENGPTEFDVRQLKAWLVIDKKEGESEDDLVLRVLEAAIDGGEIKPLED